MRCPECNRPLRRARRDYQYTESGLSNVVLEGAPVYICAQHGVQAAALRNVLAVHAAISRALLALNRPLRGAEIRFLRKHRGWSQAELANRLGVTEVTVSRWETEAAPSGAANQVVLRYLFMAPETFPPRLKFIGKPPARVPLLRIPASRSTRRATA